MTNGTRAGLTVAMALFVIMAGAATIGLIAGRQPHLWQTLAIALPGGFVVGTLANKAAHRIQRQPMTQTPEPPTDIQLHKANGQTVPLDAVYTGIEDDAHVWVAVMRGHVLDDGDQVTVGTLPPHTTVVFPMPGDDDYDVRLPPPGLNPRDDS